jgi:hypothetical protein
VRITHFPSLLFDGLLKINIASSDALFGNHFMTSIFEFSQKEIGVPTLDLNFRALIHKSFCLICSMRLAIKNKTNKKKRKLSFGSAALALLISVTVDALDYIAAPIFSTPIIGDAFDVIVTGILYSITKSKVSIIMNLAEFIPFVGDFLPVYTVSTLLWIIRQHGYESSFGKLLALLSSKR